MAGPWEQYQAAPSKGPWDQYSKQPDKPTAAPEKNYSAGATVAGMSPLVSGGEAAMNMATGMIAKPLSDIAGLAATGKEIISPTPGGGDPEAFKRHVQESMTYEPRTPQGHMLAEYNPMALLGKGIGAGAGAIAAPIRGDDSNPWRSAAANFVQEAIPQGVGLAGAKYAKTAEARTAAKQSELDIAKGVNAPLDAVRNQSQASGLVTPVEGKSWLSGIPGMGKVNDWISSENQPKINRKIAENFGIKEGVALTKDELENVRKEQGKAYQDVVDEGGKNMVTVQPPPMASKVLGADGKPVMLTAPPVTKAGFQATDKFKTAIQKQLADVEEKLTADPEVFKSMRPSARLLREQLKDDFHDPRITMEKIKKLRRDASAGFRSDEPIKISNAFTAKEVANQLEQMMEDNIKNPELLAKFRAARTKIAQSYDVEAALDNVGNVNARKLYLLSKKRPLSGNLKEVADFAGAFPEAAKTTAKGIQAITPWDYLIGLGSVAAGHPLLGLSEIGGRVGVPMAAQKGMLQKRTPSYQARSVAAPVGYGAAAGAADRPPGAE